MNIDSLFPENELPLDTLCRDGGFAKIFRTIACVGDSLSSGEFEAIHENGERTYHDFYAHSWGQYLGRTCGSIVYNFSKGGMSTKEYCEEFAEKNGFWNPAKACDAYIIALGVNDLLNMNMETGTVRDIDFSDWHNNRKTFTGYYGQILQRYHEIQPRARFFLVTMPQDESWEGKKHFYTEHCERMHELAELFPNTYVIDLFSHGPVYDKVFRDKFFLAGHMNPAGYVFTSWLIMSYIDYIIRHHMNDFSEVGFIGTDLHGNRMV